MARPASRFPRPGGTGQRKPGVIYLYGRDATADDVRNEPAARGFDFGEFRHRLRPGCACRWGRSAACAPRVCCAAEYTLTFNADSHGPAGPASSPVPAQPRTTQDFHDARCLPRFPPATGRGRLGVRACPRRRAAGCDRPIRPACRHGSDDRRGNRLAGQAFAAADRRPHVSAADRRHRAPARRTGARGARVLRSGARGEGPAARAPGHRNRPRGPPARRSPSTRPGCGASSTRPPNGRSR